MIGNQLLGTVHYPTGDAGIQDGDIDGARLRFRTMHTPQFDDEPGRDPLRGSDRRQRHSI